MIPAASAAMRAKALDYLAAGRVRVTQADDTSGIFVAAVHGEASYTVFRHRGRALALRLPGGAPRRAVLTRRRRRPGERM